MVRRLSEKILNTLVPSAGTAGACVPENGTVCKCLNRVAYYYSCTGVCTKTTISC